MLSVIAGDTVAKTDTKGWISWLAMQPFDVTRHQRDFDFHLLAYSSAVVL